MAKPADGKYRTSHTASLRRLVADVLHRAGWTRVNGQFLPPKFLDKDQLRGALGNLRVERAEREREVVDKFGPTLLQEFAESREVDPCSFSPALFPVQAGTWDAMLFRFATLLWSVPVSRGYGRRMRYLIRDMSNNKLVGVFALGDPVFNLRARDLDIGWTVDDREARLYHVFDAYVLGAVPPYSRLLAGKFVALAAISDEVRSDFAKRYRGHRTSIRRKRRPASLVLVTTISGLGRSSIYNRLRLPEEVDPAYRSVGFSGGWGHFHIGDATFLRLRGWLREVGDPYADGHGYGQGPNWRLRTIRRALDLLGFNGDLLKHSIEREVFAAPLASNYREFLRGEHKQPRYFRRSLKMLAEAFKDRWMIPRSQRFNDWSEWTRRDTWEAISANIRPR